MESFPLALITLGKQPKKNGKKFHYSCKLWGGGQQILVCEPQKSAFLELIFQKTFIMSHLFVYTKYNHLIHSKIQMQGFI